MRCRPNAYAEIVRRRMREAGISTAPTSSEPETSRMPSAGRHRSRDDRSKLIRERSMQTGNLGHRRHLNRTCARRACVRHGAARTAQLGDILLNVRPSPVARRTNPRISRSRCASINEINAINATISTNAEYSECRMRARAAPAGSPVLTNRPIVSRRVSRKAARVRSMHAAEAPSNRFHTARLPPNVAVFVQLAITVN